MLKKCITRPRGTHLNQTITAHSSKDVFGVINFDCKKTPFDSLKIYYIFMVLCFQIRPLSLCKVSLRKITSIKKKVYFYAWGEKQSISKMFCHNIFLILMRNICVSYFLITYSVL